MTAPTSGRTIADVGEFALIALIRERLGTVSAKKGSGLIIGPGDDAAEIAAASGSLLISSDLLIEGRHIRRDWSSAEDVGRKAAAANLSDINAMGGSATALTVSLGLPGDLDVDWVLQCADGLAAECAVVGAEIAGGDITAADAIVIAISAVGHTTRAVRRDTAAPGDVVAFAGQLGLAGAGFATLSRGFRSPRAVVDAHRVPTPPYTAGPQAAEAGANSLIDVSDGLLADLGHIARSSGVVIDLDSTTFPISEWVATVADALGTEPLRYVLTGGDDYALVGSFNGDIPQGWTRIGAVRQPETGEEPVVLVDGAPFDGPPGHQHFR